ncbi:Cation/H+ exchanger [Dillenia turbinata]|uniref:Cation/H+ exchanger n=1 Tax=Dillenia turbinata TaxID=194707 RepID=A0AAN8VEU8_9MAGN
MDEGTESEHQLEMPNENRTFVCQDRYAISHMGTAIWSGCHPLDYATPLLLTQLTLITVMSNLVNFCLKPLAQSSMVSQILLHSLEFLARLSESVRKVLFPARGSLSIETMATFGLMYFLFAVGVKMDPGMMKRPGKKAGVVGASIFFISLAVSIAVAFILIKCININKSLASALPLVAGCQALSAFPVISCLLTELKILNNELGRLAISSTIGPKMDVCSIAFKVVVDHQHMLNAKGINELIVYNQWQENEVLSDEDFSIVVLSLVTITAFITPLIKFLYAPSGNPLPIKRRTIQHARPNTQLKIVVCIHNQDNIPTEIDLLDILHATEESPLSVMAILLIELTSLRSDHITNAFRQFEDKNQTVVMVKTYTAISYFETVHNDIVEVALDNSANIIIMPFHQQ